MKTITDFKKRIVKGAKIHTIWHQKAIGRAEDGQLIFGSEDRGVREVTRVQSNSFALGTEKEGKIADSWCEYPKLKEIQFVDENTVTIMTPDFRNGETYGQLMPCLTYKFVG